MASLRGARVLNIQKVLCQVTARRCIATSKPLAWNKDNKAKKLPATKEEADRAAKSYNLIPEDYKPASSNSKDGLGDYPDVTPVPLESRDPNIDWDYRASRRNYGEPVYVDHDMIGRSDKNLEKRYLASYPVQFLTIFLVLGGLYGLHLILNRYPLHHRAKPKQYPYNYLDTLKRVMISEDDIQKRVHYTFEPAAVAEE